MTDDLTTPPTEAEIAQAIDGRGGAISGIISRLAFHRDMLLARVEASPPLAWTDAKPTVPGWWWWRDSHWTEPIHVIKLRGELGVPGHEIGDVDPFPDGQFAGPIPPPADARTRNAAK